MCNYLNFQKIASPARGGIATKWSLWGNDTVLACHCEERSDMAISMYDIIK